jgi:hypothetical protein
MPQLYRQNVNPHGTTFSASDPVRAGTIFHVKIAATDTRSARGNQVTLLLYITAGHDQTDAVLVMTPSDAATIGARLTEAANAALQEQTRPEPEAGR